MNINYFFTCFILITFFIANLSFAIMESKSDRVSFGDTCKSMALTSFISVSFLLEIVFFERAVTPVNYVILAGFVVMGLQVIGAGWGALLFSTNYYSFDSAIDTFFIFNNMLLAAAAVISPAIILCMVLSR